MTGEGADRAGTDGATDFAAFDRLVGDRLSGWVDELVEFLRIPSEGVDAEEHHGAADGLREIATAGADRL